MPDMRPRALQRAVEQLLRRLFRRKPVRLALSRSGTSPAPDARYDPKQFRRSK